MNEYTTYLLECMREGRKKLLVGSSMNRRQLKSKHVFNKKMNATTSKTKEFISLLTHRVLGTAVSLAPTYISDDDLLESMAQLLGAEEHFFKDSCNFHLFRRTASLGG